MLLHPLDADIYYNKGNDGKFNFRNRPKRNTEIR